MVVRWKGLPILLLVLLTGCSIFRRPENQFYALRTVGPAGTTDLQGLPIAIESIEIPPALARRGIVVIDDDHKLEVRGREQWAAPFDEMVLHTLAFDLADRLPEGMIVLPGQIKPSRASMRPIDLIFETFAAGPEAQVTLDARWVLAGVTHHEVITVDTGSLDTESVVSGMSDALAELAERIVEGIKRKR